MRELPLRLPPGADLRRALEDLAARALADGAFVVCGIGSLLNPRLRLAGQDAETVFPGPYEVLSLCGTVTASGAHLHACLASETGQVVGGHVVYGNEVRTTVETLLVALEAWSLTRVPDAGTGFLELQVSPVSPVGEAPSPGAPLDRLRSAARPTE